MSWLSIKNYFSLVRFSHTVFALPFACIGFVLAYAQTDAVFAWRTLALVLSCMVFARNTAMSFNRYADRQFDACNRRTAIREIPRGVITPRQALLFCVVNAALFVLAAALLNRLCLYLSPVALLVIVGYSLTKRFTWMCHGILGLSMSIAPTAAYIAVSGDISLTPVCFSAIVLLWGSGFDILYALPDEAFDRQEGLFSIPARFGRRRAMVISAGLHTVAAALVVVAGWTLHAGIFYITGATLFCGLLLYQHLIIKPSDLSRLNTAFATTNGLAGVLFGVGVMMELLL
ncbi:MAG: putative 4-hydroxybenzoate polyprenyltransferase [Prevotellaceae bacterium]|jgi:4-hydroxybenzoate polyprenyltransferase|nr:putative 4-hydroxybenzoate polyprenyltransferase [Prevotellaceae bacterium]